MKFDVKRSGVYVQIIVPIIIIAGSLILKNMVYISITAILGILLIRDAIKNMNTYFEVDDTGIKMVNSTGTTKAVAWNDVEFLTISRTNKNWVVVGNRNVTITIKPATIGQRELIKLCVKYLNKRKKVYIHESLLF